jgi:hypothetical protein
MSQPQLANRQLRLYCFSPPVMLVTLLFEFVGAIYTVYRYRLNRVGRLITIGLLALGTFQLSEYLICEVTFLPDLTWAKVGFVAITLLPPLGVHLTSAIAGKRNWSLLALIYVLAAAFVIYFGYVSDSLMSQVCAGNYVIFTMNPASRWWYAAYYFGLLLLGICLSLRFARRTSDQRVRQALIALTIGYGTFIIPTITVNLLQPETISAVPSIMCGFAILLAIDLIGFVLPRVGLQRKRVLPVMS